MKDIVEHIIDGGRLLAIIVPSGFRHDGIQFFTPNDCSQQLAYMNRPAGYCILPHVHNPVRREIMNTQEVLLIRSGKVLIDFYNDEREFVGERLLNPGDVILIVSGGHGFKMLEASEIIEVKQGPYLGDEYKVQFDGIDRREA